MVIILLLIANVLRLYYVNYFLINEVILFIQNNYFVSIFLLLIFLFGSTTRLVPRTIWVSQTLHNEPTIEILFPFTISQFYILKH